MTEAEKLAEEYVNNEVPFNTTDSGERLYTESDLKYSFLAGYKAGKPKWHKVADGDLPKRNTNSNDPLWDEHYKYRIKPEPKKRLMTNRELAKIGEEAILKIKEMIEELSNDNEEEKL